MEVIADDKRFCRYLDMPFQHINNEVLEAMNRKIDRVQIENKIHGIWDTETSSGFGLAYYFYRWLSY